MKRKVGNKKPLTKNDIDFFIAGDIVNDIDRIEKILSSRIFAPRNQRHPLVKSAFIELIICLRDLLSKAEKYASRVSFTDDVIITSEVKDVTDLVRFIRDALCHIYIYSHFIVSDRIKASFFIFYGKITHAPFKPDHSVVFVSEYSDDVCFFFGLTRIYLKRHIIRAYYEARDQLLPLPTFPNDILIYEPPNS